MIHKDLTDEWSASGENSGMYTILNDTLGQGGILRSMEQVDAIILAGILN